jgi:hypothetical protein
MSDRCLYLPQRTIEALLPEDRDNAISANGVLIAGTASSVPMFFPPQQKELYPLHSVSVTHARNGCVLRILFENLE